MASRAAQKQSSLPERPSNNAIDNYDVDDDPFAESGDEAPDKDSQSKKRKEATGLGIDEAVAVQKKARVPNVKLDESRLLSEKGIPRLRRKARDLKFKGKGHEFSDAARLLSFYQLWFDDLFPKAKFMDAAAMAEKAGHKKYMRIKRMEWIDEGKPKPPSLSDDEDLFGESNGQSEERSAAIFPARVAPIFQNQQSERPKTPTRDDVPDDDDDIYSATPLASRPQPASTSMFGNGEASTTGGASKSLFGNGGEPDEDDLDALMAEEEAQRTKPTSLFGNGAQKPAQPRDEPEDDLDALMAEAEASEGPPKQSDPAPKPTQATKDNEDDDLDALMAEAEAQNQPKQSTIPKPKEVSQNVADADEEEAMAEMDGLW
ncbi:Swi3-domain-containing protein [Hypomontagnella monticulosa]|nr:Swi3-domain-containing protein [Hypomontagnella monticulosa]